MSVPAGEREEGKFTLPIKAEYLARYTLTITANEKVFSPEYRRSVTDDIVETAKNIYLNIREANDTVVRMGTPFQTEAFRRRNRLHEQVLQE